MVETSLTALKKEKCSVMITSLLKTSVAASRLIAPPVLWTRPFPIEDAKKYHVTSIMHLFCNQDKVASVYRFLNWSLGPSDHICNVGKFSLSSCLMMCSGNTVIHSLEWLRLSNTTIAEDQPILCQMAAVKIVIWFLCIVFPKSGINLSKINLQKSCAFICFCLFLQLLLNKKMV